MNSTPRKKADAVQGSVAPASEEFTHGPKSDPMVLAEVYRRRLQSEIFTNRGVLSPGMLSRIASEEADILLNYFAEPRAEAAELRGMALCELGLSIQSLLGLGEASRQFFLEQPSGSSVLPVLQAIDSYHHALIRGFMEGRERFILVEQERLRSAYQKAIGR